MPEKKKRSKLKVALIVVLAVLVVLTGAFIIYTQDYYHADKTALQALNSSISVTVTQQGNLITFLPNGTTATTGFIFYPGGKVEATAYAPLLNALASQGYACVLVKMPFNLAVFDINAADRARAALPQVTTWYVGGHSLGGSMVCAWAAKNPDKCAGLVLLGSYTASDLSQTNLKALVVTGSNDGELNRTAFEKSKDKMPDDTFYMEIGGGNHAEYGNYGEQKGDGKATISADVQQSITEKAIVQFFSGTFSQP